MKATKNINTGYVIIALPAAVMGGLLALLVTNAVPRMMKRMMAGMMEDMRTQMSVEGCKADDL